MFFDPNDQPIESATGRSQITVYGPHAKITGRIIDAQGQAVPGVEAVAFLDDQPIGINGQTGSNGSYLIDNLTPAGRVTIKATRPAGVRLVRLPKGLISLFWNQPRFAV